MPGAASEAPKSGLIDRVACDDRTRARRTGPKDEDLGKHGGVGVGDFCVRGAVRDEGIGRPGGGRVGKGKGKGKGWFWGRAAGTVYVLY